MKRSTSLSSPKIQIVIFITAPSSPALFPTHKGTNGHADV